LEFYGFARFWKMLGGRSAQKSMNIYGIQLICIVLDMGWGVGDTRMNEHLWNSHTFIKRLSKEKLKTPKFIVSVAL
jgi:hypothetical protein